MGTLRWPLTLPEAVAVGLQAYARRITSELRLELLRPLLRLDQDAPPSEDYLRACGISTIENDALAREVVDIYTTATRNAQSFATR